MVHFVVTTIALAAVTAVAAPAAELGHESIANRGEGYTTIVPPMGNSHDQSLAKRADRYSSIVPPLGNANNKRHALDTTKRDAYLPSPDPIWAGSAEANAILKTVNGFREQLGAPPVRWDNDMSGYIKWNAQQCYPRPMFQNGDPKFMSPWQDQGWSFWEEKAEVDWLAELRDVLNRAYGASSDFNLDTWTNQQWWDGDSAWICAGWKAQEKMACGYSTCHSKDSGGARRYYRCVFDKIIAWKESDPKGWAENLPNPMPEIDYTRPFGA